MKEDGQLVVLAFIVSAAVCFCCFSVTQCANREASIILWHKLNPQPDNLIEKQKPTTP